MVLSGHSDSPCEKQLWFVKADVSQLQTTCSLVGDATCFMALVTQDCYLQVIIFQCARLQLWRDFCARTQPNWTQTSVQNDKPATSVKGKGSFGIILTDWDKDSSSDPVSVHCLMGAMFFKRCLQRDSLSRSAPAHAFKVRKNAMTSLFEFIHWSSVVKWQWIPFFIRQWVVLEIHWVGQVVE